MNGKLLLNKVGGLVLAALLLFGSAIMSSTTVQARGGGSHGGGFHGGGGFRGGGGGFRGGGRFRGGGGFRGGIFIGPRFGYGYYGYPYGYYGYPYGYSSQYVFSSSGAAENKGYQDGFYTGSNDARREQSYNPDRSHYFRDAGFGNFADAYREGFSRGYSDGYGR